MRKSSSTSGTSRYAAGAGGSARAAGSANGRVGIARIDERSAVERLRQEPVVLNGLHGNGVQHLAVGAVGGVPDVVWQVLVGDEDVALAQDRGGDGVLVLLRGRNRVIGEHGCAGALEIRGPALIV